MQQVETDMDRDREPDSLQIAGDEKTGQDTDTKEEKAPKTGRRTPKAIIAYTAAIAVLALLIAEIPAASAFSRCPS